MIILNVFTPVAHNLYTDVFFRSLSLTSASSSKVTGSLRVTVQIIISSLIKIINVAALPVVKIKFEIQVSMKTDFFLI